MDFSDIKAALEDIELGILSYRGYHLADESSLVQQALQIERVLDQDETKRSLGNEDYQYIKDAASRIQALAGAFLQVEQGYLSLRDEVLRESKTIIARESRGDHSSKMRKAKLKASQTESPDSLPSHHLRQYFLDHLDDPYPSLQDKGQLLAMTNNPPKKASARGPKQKPLSLSQLTLWFINARRRSGWSVIMQRYAGNDRSKMQSISIAMMRQQGMLPYNKGLTTSTEADGTLEELLNPNQDPRSPASMQRTAELKKEWRSMVSWIRIGVKEKVGDWMDDIIRAAKHQTVKQECKAARMPRVASTAANKGKVVVGKRAPSNIKSSGGLKNRQTSTRMLRTRFEGSYQDDGDSDQEQSTSDRQQPSVLKAERSATPPDYSEIGHSFPSVLAKPMPARRDLSGDSIQSIFSTSTDSSLFDNPYSSHLTCPFDAHSRNASNSSFTSLEEEATPTPKAVPDQSDMITPMTYIPPLFPSRPIKRLPFQHGQPNPTPCTPCRNVSGSRTRSLCPSSDCSTNSSASTLSAAVSFKRRGPAHNTESPSDSGYSSTNSSPTTLQETRFRFLNDQPSDSDGSPVLHPLRVSTQQHNLAHQCDATPKQLYFGPADGQKPMNQPPRKPSFNSYRRLQSKQATPLKGSGTLDQAFGMNLAAGNVCSLSLEG